MERTKRKKSCKKRLLSLILAFMMTFSCLSWEATVYADPIDDSMISDAVICEATEQSDLEIEVGKVSIAEDAFVGSWSGDQTANFGSQSYLRTSYSADSVGILGTGSGGDNKVTYLKFNISSINRDEFQNARLNLTLLGVRKEAAVGQNIKILVGVAGNEWTESALTWENKPELITEESGLAESEIFVPGNVSNNDPANITTPDGTPVIVDITNFVCDAIGRNEEFLTLAVNIDNSNAAMTDADANRIFFVSKEGADFYANASEMEPALLLTRAPDEEEKILDHIEVTAPTKTKYGLGESLDLEGMTITAFYLNADSVDLSVGDVDISGFDSETSGKKTVTVAYQDKNAAFTIAVVENYTGFVPDTQWLDSDGNMIQAHGGGVIWDDKSQKYYWYGENKGEKGTTGVVEAIGVSCYSSTDLYNWDYEGMALPVFNNPAFLGNSYRDDTPLYLAESSEEYQIAKQDGVKVSAHDTLEKYNSEEAISALNELYTDVDAATKKNLYDMLNWDCVVERPKVIYNENTEKYVMWFHKDGKGAGKYDLAHAAVAVSDSPAGPFKLVDSSRPNGNMSRDMTLFKDEDGTAYLLHSSENNQVLYITELDEDYTGVTGKYSRNYVYGTGEPWAREAPAIFKYEGDYYLISSGCTGWDPNKMGYSVAQDLTEGMSKDGGNGPFQFENKQVLPNPCTGTGADITFGGQSTYVLPVQGREGCFIYMGDKWKPKDLTDSRYQWLPIIVDSEAHTLTIPWTEEWDLDALERMNKWKLLDDAIEEVEQRYAAEYTTDTRKKVQDAYDAAKSLDESTASQEDIKKAAEGIKDALKRLVKVKVETENFDLIGKKITADSQEDKSAKNQAEKAIDGKDDTFWHTSWDNASDPLPHYITIDLGASVDNLYELRYLPRQDKDFNGLITEYEILTSNADKQLEELADEDFTTVRHGKWTDDKTEKSAVFLTDKAVRYLRLRVLTGYGGYASAAEIKLNVKKGQKDLDTVALGKAVEEAKKFNDGNYTTHSTELLKHALETAEKLINDKQTVTQAQVDTAEQILTAVTGAMVLKEVDEKRYTSVPVGKSWLDTEGDPIQAHGGGFLQQTDTDGTPIYYWAGEDKAHNTSNFNGISLYSSKDLLNWTYRGTILQPDVTNAGLSDNKIERPKLIYNEATQKYVLWGHWEDKSGYSSSQICVAVCDTVDGEYEFLGHWRPGADGEHRNWRISENSAQFDDGREINSYDDQAVWGTGSRDFTIYVDGSDAYLISAEDHETMRIYQLNDSFTDVDEEAMESYQLFQGARREAPALVKSGDYYFMISSAQSGWYPNQTRYSYTKDISDPNGWSVMDSGSDIKMPSGYLGNNTTFYSQPTNIMTLSGETGTSYVYMGDRWNSEKLGSSTYVWLPLSIEETDTPIMTMDYESGWSLNTKTAEIVVPGYLLISEGKKAETDVNVSNENALKLENANDGEYINTNTTGGNHAYFKPGAVPFTYTIDLGKVTGLARIDLSFNCHNGSEAYYQYTVDTSEEGEKWSTSVHEDRNTIVGFKSHDFKETEARYVRISVDKVINAHNGNEADWAAGLVEVQIYGEKNKEIGKAKQLAEAAVAAITATNDTTKEDVLDAVTNAITSLDGVTAAWKAEPTITAATNSAAGSIAGIIVLTSDTETAQVEINLSIAQLAKTDKEKVEEAKTLAETAISGITAENTTTGDDILDAVTAGIASVDAVSAAWKDEPVITAATEDLDGSIVGTIVLTCGNERVEIPVNKVIARQSHSHAYGSEWKSDKNSHWHECTKADCPEPKKDIAEHTAGNWITDKTATETMTGSKHKECTVCKYVVQTEEIPMKQTYTYEFIKGANSEWEHNSNSGLSFTVDGDFENFVGVRIKGKVIDPSNYVAKKGSTIITLKPEYLRTLSSGKYTLEVIYTDKVVSTGFTIKGTGGSNTPGGTNTNGGTGGNGNTGSNKGNNNSTSNSGSVKTGDTNNLLLLFTILLVSGGTITVLLMKRRRSRHNSK